MRGSIVLKSGRAVISAEDEHTAAEGGDTREIAGSDRRRWHVDNRRNEFGSHGYIKTP